MYCCEVNLVQAKDNNANGINEMTYMYIMGYLWKQAWVWRLNKTWGFAHEMVSVRKLYWEINEDEDGSLLYGFQCMINVDSNHRVT